MATETCVHCGKDVAGRVQDVVLTLCCVKCAFPNLFVQCRSADAVWISKTKARREYKCKPQDLEILNYAERDNPKNNGTTMKLYLRAEVQALKMTTSSRKKAERLRRKYGLPQKKAELEQECGVNLRALSVGVRHFLLGDYLNQMYETTTTRRQVIERCRVLERVKEIVRTCDGAHPEAAFDFCLENREAGPEQFQALKEKMRSVFRMFGAKILHKVPLPELEDLDDSPLADVYKEFEDRDSDALIRGHLLQWMDKKTAETIMNDPACQDRIERGGDEFVVAKKLAEFWEEKDDYQKREQKLKTALNARELPHILDSEFCAAYLNGDLDCDVEEVVGEIDLQERFECYPYPLDWRFDAAFESFRDNLSEEKLDYDVAIDDAFDMAVNELCTEEEEEFYDEHCCWCDEHFPPNLANLLYGFDMPFYDLDDAYYFDSDISD